MLHCGIANGSTLYMKPLSPCIVRFASALMCAMALFASRGTQLGALAADAAEPTILRGPVSFDNFKSVQMLSKAELQYDINYYIFAVTHAYVGYRFAPERGSRSLVANLRAWEAPETMTALDF